MHHELFCGWAISRCMARCCYHGSIHLRTTLADTVTQVEPRRSRKPYTAALVRYIGKKIKNSRLVRYVLVVLILESSRQALVGY